MKLLKIVLMICSVTIPELSVQLKAIYVISIVGKESCVIFESTVFLSIYNNGIAFEPYLGNYLL